MFNQCILNKIILNLTGNFYAEISLKINESGFIKDNLVLAKVHNLE